jgi:hypothetical protein
MTTAFNFPISCRVFLLVGAGPATVIALQHGRLVSVSLASRQYPSGLGTSMPTTMYRQHAEQAPPRQPYRSSRGWAAKRGVS